jgi:hypothetical protein
MGKKGRKPRPFDDTSDGKTGANLALRTKNPTEFDRLLERRDRRAIC